MHIVGKILILMLALCAVFGFIFGARLVNTRANYMKQLQDAKVSDEKTAEKLAKARQDFEDARALYDREMLRWNHYYQVKGVYDAVNNAIVANAGTTLGIQPKTEFYAFQIDANGASTYVGSFNALEVAKNESGLKATFPVRAEDVPTWNGQNFRLRTGIPAAFVKRIADLQTELVNRDELLKKQEKNLATQGELVAAARDQRDTRVAELLGGGAGITTGLVTDINQSDDARNASLQRVDDLRRKIFDAKARVKGLIQENNNLAASLPGQPPKQQAEAVRHGS
jgi:hypothetical protein